MLIVIAGTRPVPQPGNELQPVMVFSDFSLFIDVLVPWHFLPHTFILDWLVLASCAYNLYLHLYHFLILPCCTVLYRWIVYSLVWISLNLIWLHHRLLCTNCLLYIYTCIYYIFKYLSFINVWSALCNVQLQQYFFLINNLNQKACF